MRLSAVLVLLLLSLSGVQAQAGENSLFAHPAGIRYTLLDGSYFVDDCLICGRPTILQPLAGTFDLLLLRDTPPLAEYEVRNIDFVAGPGFNGEAAISGSGIYRIFSEFANLQSMELTTEIQDAGTNHVAYFTNGFSVVTRPFPLIDIDVSQTNGVLIQTFSMRLIAAPVREVWFSLNHPLTTTNQAGQPCTISPGDLISNRGRVVKPNIDLVGRLGVMPVTPDLGLDAVEVIRCGEILFSIPDDIWSELLGQIQHGDLLSNRGRIVKRNQQLLAAFGVESTAADAGLDAVQRMPGGEILFSTSSNVVLTTGQTLQHGDILSDAGHVFRTHDQLLSHFHPAVTNQDHGLDALWVMPDGEIWFSIEQGFLDNWLGPIGPGDILSERGYRVFSNRQLVADFHPEDPTMDYGLDALFVVTDMRPHVSPPRFCRVQRDWARHRFCLDWEGEGSVFQVEKAPTPWGPWEACSPLLPDSSFEDECDSGNEAQAFYRLRQW